jgi:hypothetical protein
MSTKQPSFLQHSGHDDKLPKEFFFMRELLLSGLWRSPEHWSFAPETH